jgi:hypothetical protein
MTVDRAGRRASSPSSRRPARRSASVAGAEAAVLTRFWRPARIRWSRSTRTDSSPKSKRRTSRRPTPTCLTPAGGGGPGGGATGGCRSAAVRSPPARTPLRQEHEPDQVHGHPARVDRRGGAPGCSRSGHLAVRPGQAARPARPRKQERRDVMSDISPVPILGVPSAGFEPATPASGGQCSIP